LLYTQAISAVQFDAYCHASTSLYTWTTFRSH